MRGSASTRSCSAMRLGHCAAGECAWAVSASLCRKCWRGLTDSQSEKPRSAHRQTKSMGQAAAHASAPVPSQQCFGLCAHLLGQALPAQGTQVQLHVDCHHNVCGTGHGGRASEAAAIRRHTHAALPCTPCACCRRPSRPPAPACLGACTSSRASRHRSNKQGRKTEPGTTHPPR